MGHDAALGRPVTGFRRHRRSGAAVATFTVHEADLLRSLAGQVIELLRLLGRFAEGRRTGERPGTRRGPSSSTSL